MVKGVMSVFFVIIVCQGNNHSKVSFLRDLIREVREYLDNPEDHTDSQIAKLEIVDLLNMRDPNTGNEMSADGNNNQNTFLWPQLLFEEDNHSAESRYQKAQELIHILNEQAQDAPNKQYKWPTGFVFGGDLRYDPLGSVNNVLINTNAHNLLYSRYVEDGEASIVDIAGIPDMLSDFYSQPLRDPMDLLTYFNIGHDELATI
jgi:hypothetical protein